MGQQELPFLALTMYFITHKCQAMTSLIAVMNLLKTLTQVTLFFLIELTHNFAVSLQLLV
jgi:hypothetical protein